MVVEDAITPLERRLYFTTAHAHFKAGCPSLALEVLSKLPNKVLSPSVSRKSSNASLSLTKPLVSAVNKSIDTGILDEHLGKYIECCGDVKLPLLCETIPIYKSSMLEITVTLWSCK